jgi:H+/Cl- antiporter ClcA
MTNRTVGTVLLVTSGACCTLGVVGAKLAAALEKSLFHLAGHGGYLPTGADKAQPGWLLTTAVVVLAVLGVRFLFTRD